MELLKIMTTLHSTYFDAAANHVLQSSAMKISHLVIDFRRSNCWFGHRRQYGHERRHGHKRRRGAGVGIGAVNAGLAARRWEMEAKRQTYYATLLS